ncbi:hypothetical protein [Mesorhizobium sp. B1-1-1]|nr:hypothetical protein [Mesorhizobium sp. B1-1-1]
MGTRSAKDAALLDLPALLAPAESIWELTGVASRGLIERLTEIPAALDAA